MESSCAQVGDLSPIVSKPTIIASSPPPSSSAAARPIPYTVVAYTSFSYRTVHNTRCGFLLC